MDRAFSAGAARALRTRRLACRSIYNRTAGCWTCGLRRVHWWVVTSGGCLLTSVSSRYLIFKLSSRRMRADPPSVFSKGGFPAHRVLQLPLRLAADHLLYFWLLRSARIVASLKRLFRLALLARGAFGFLAVFFAER